MKNQGPRTSASGQDGITGTRFILSLETTSRQTTYMKNNFQDPAVKDSKTWETQNKWHEPHHCPQIDALRTYQARAQERWSQVDYLSWDSAESPEKTRQLEFTGQSAGEKGDAQREREFQNILSLQLRMDQQMCVRKLLKVGERSTQMD